MLWKKSAAELSTMLKNGECSSVELTKSVFGRIAETEDKVAAYVSLCEEAALAFAKISYSGEAIRIGNYILRNKVINFIRATIP